MNNTQTPTSAKEYLMQVYKIDQQINNKLEQVARMRELAQRVTATFENDPVTHTRNVNVMADSVMRIWEAEQALDHEVDKLVNLKAEVQLFVARITDVDCQLLLEKRYLCMYDWTRISKQLCIGRSSVYALHSRALDMADALLEIDAKQSVV